MKKQKVEALEIHQPQLAKIIPIRTETVLSQYPIHKLSKDKKPVQIIFTRENQRGKLETAWEVTGNVKYGHPGILAYKLDTLFINRLIDELHPNIPEVIKIGNSLRDICDQLGTERNTPAVKKALYQNALAGITAKLEYTGKDKTRRKFEFTSTRYGIVMVGETLPDGTTAEAVYIVLNPLYRELLQRAKRRPLDYEYLKDLPPAAQRWYELVSFQIFAALDFKNPRANYRYSELCARIPLTRFYTWEQAKKQLNKIHRLHIKSGYLSKVEVEETTDEHNVIDWFLKYTPGRRAKREYQEFNERLEVESLPKIPTGPRLVEAKGEGKEGPVEGRAENRPLIEKLMSLGIGESRAVRLVEKDQAECEQWASAWPYQNQKGMENPPAVLIRFIETKHRPFPAAYKKAQQAEERKREQEALEIRQRAGELHYSFFAPSYNLRLKDELSKIELMHPNEYQTFREWFDKKHSRGLRMIEAEDHRERVTLQRAQEFFNDIRPDLNVRMSTFDEWNAIENEGNADPVKWFKENPTQVRDLLTF